MAGAGGSQVATAPVPLGLWCRWVVAPGKCWGAWPWALRPWQFRLGRHPGSAARRGCVHCQRRVVLRVCAVKFHMGKFLQLQFGRALHVITRIQKEHTSPELGGAGRAGRKPRLDVGRGTGGLAMAQAKWELGAPVLMRQMRAEARSLTSNFSALFRP